MSAPEVRPATRDDRAVALRTIVRGFATDPLLRFFFPEDHVYDASAPVFFGFLFDIRLDRGEVLLADDGLAVALWTPPEGLTIPDAEVDRRWASDVSPRLREEDQARIERFEAAHEGIAPEGPHRYLGVLATDPDHRGRGLARAVLDPVFARDDTEGIPAHLETCTPQNLPFYARFGFGVHAETTIEDGPRLWELVRQPGAAVG
jgi:GNAT superfamily N-acetyltransferase